jgi:hypothetical protein
LDDDYVGKAAAELHSKPFLRLAARHLSTVRMSLS